MVHSHTVDGQNSLSHHFEAMVDTITFVGIYVGEPNQKQGFLEWRMS